MGLRYKLMKDVRKNSATSGKYFARSVVNETKGIDELAEHMANHNTPYSKGAIKGILTDMVVCIKELVLNGIAVKIDDLAIFSVGIKTKAADSAKAFSAATNVLSYHLRARATGQFTRKQLSLAGEIKERTSTAWRREPPTTQALLLALAARTRANREAALTAEALEAQAET